MSPEEEGPCKEGTLEEVAHGALPRAVGPRRAQQN